MALHNLEQGTSTIWYEYATSKPGAQARVAQIANFPRSTRCSCKVSIYNSVHYSQPHPVKYRDKLRKLRFVKWVLQSG